MREIWRIADDGKMNETLFLQSTPPGLGGNLFVGICLVFPSGLHAEISHSFWRYDLFQPLFSGCLGVILFGSMRSIRGIEFFLVISRNVT